MTRRRVFLLVLFTLISCAALGSATVVRKEEAYTILENVEKNIPYHPTTIDIFINNVRVALLMLIPGLGLILAPYVLYNTGLVFAATGVVNDISGLVLLLATAILPFFWLEFVAYAASITQNLYLIWAIKSRALRCELKYVGYTLVIIVVLLLLGAWIETLFLSSWAR